MKVAIFSPAATGSVGHGFVYALRLCKYLSENNDVILFTLNDNEKVQELKENGIKVNLSSSFPTGSIDKKRFNKYGLFKELIYGIYRIYYNYSLLKEFFRKNIDIETKHLFEFEYISTFLFFLFRRKNLKQSVLGFHASDYCWIKGRSITVNLYKVFLKFLLPYLIKNSKSITVHGDFIRERYLKIFKLKGKYAEKVVTINYGCNVKEEKPGRKEELRKEFGFEQEDIVGLFFGVIRAGKGLLELLSVFKNIDKKVKLFIVGSEGDISKEKIISTINNVNLNNRIKFRIEYVREEDIENYFYASDFVFITHKGFHLSFSGPLSLAVEYSRPVIASNIGEIGSFVRNNGNGELFECEKWSNLVEKTNSFVYNIDKWRKFDFDSLQKNNSWYEMAKKIEIAYNTK